MEFDWPRGVNVIASANDLARCPRDLYVPALSPYSDVTYES